MQPGERQLHLGLHPGHPGQPAAARPPGQVLNQHGLAYSRLAVHHQHPALTSPHSVNQPGQHGALAAPASRLVRDHWRIPAR
jgi:hypothetical protein